MTQLDSRYIPLNNLQGLSVDKIDAKPLAAGYAHFMYDNARQIYKSIYKLTGQPGAYTFIEIDNPVQLTSYGSFQDNGQDITIYLFPYDNDGALEKYFLNVTDDSGTQQYYRESIPYTLEEQLTQNISLEEYNHVINGQFKFINKNIIPNFSYNVSKAVDASDQEFFICGHWTDYEINACSTDFYGNFFFAKDYADNIVRDYITIKKVVLGDGVIEGDPSYYFNFKCTTLGTGESYKSFGLIFSDVRSFQNENVTIALQARSMYPNTSIGISIEQNFGINGSPSVLTVSPPNTLASSFDKVIWKPFIPSVENKDIQDNNNLIIYIDMPADEICDIDFINLQFNETLITFPYFKRSSSELQAYEKAISLPSIPKNVCINPFEKENHVIKLTYDRGRISTPFLSYAPMDPVGSGRFWYINKAAPIGWFFPQGQTFSKTRFLELYNLWGNYYGDGANATATVLNNVVTITNSIAHVGSLPGPIDGSGDYATGFPMTVNPPGSNPQVIEITCNAASTFGNNPSYLAYFKMTTVMPVTFAPFEWKVCLFKENLINLVDPEPSFFIYPYENIVFVKILSDWDNNEVAQALMNALNPIAFQVVDRRGYGSRFPDDGSGIDTLVGDRIPTPGGIASSVGSIQNDTVKSHVHNMLQWRNYNVRAGEPYVVYAFYTSSGGQTPQSTQSDLTYQSYTCAETGNYTMKSPIMETIGSSEGVMKNQYVYEIIKF